MAVKSPVKPLAGIQPLTTVTPDIEATAEQRLGGPANPVHGIPGEQAQPYPWEVFPGQTHGPYGLDNQLLSAYGLGVLAESAGTLDQDPTADFQPISHAAPWPKGVPQSVLPDDVHPRRQESADIHASNMGGSRQSLYSPTLLGVNDDWTSFTETVPGESMQVPIPSQVMTGGVGGFGSTDRTQSMQEQNQYGYDSTHMHKRWARGPIPGNTLWMVPGGRPIVRSPRGTAQVPVGQDSPFTGQVPSEAFTTSGAALAVLPAEYTGPPSPTLAPAFAGVGAVPNIPLW